MKKIQNRARGVWRRVLLPVRRVRQSSLRWTLSLRYANLKWRIRRGLRPKAELCLRLYFALKRAIRLGLAKPVLIRQRVKRYLLQWTRRPQRNATSWCKSLAVCFDVRHFEALCLLMEQRCIRLDLLAQLLGVPVAEARRVVEVCIGLGLVVDERFLVKERHPWAWLTRIGALTTDANHPPVRRPSLFALDHADAVVRVRILLTDEKQPHPFLWRLRNSLRSLARMFADGLGNRCGYVLVPKPSMSRLVRNRVTWVSRLGLLLKQRTDRIHVPDAMLVSQDREHALLIGLGPKTRAKLREILTHLSRSFDEVNCFCTPRERRMVRRAIEESGLRNVHVFDMPKAPVATSLKDRFLAHLPRCVRAGLRRLGLNIPASVVLAGTPTRGRTSSASDMLAQKCDGGRRAVFIDVGSSVEQAKRFAELMNRHRNGLDRLWRRLCLAVKAAPGRIMCAMVAVKEKVSRYVASLNAAPSDARLCEPPSTRFDLVHFEALCFLEEEEFIRADMLGRLLGIPLSEACEAIDLCVELGLANKTRVFMYEDSPWAWPTKGGLLTVGSAKQPPKPPSLSRLGYLKARTSVRIFLTEAPRRGRLGNLGRSIVVKIATWLAAKAGYALAWKPAPGVLQSSGACWVCQDDRISRYPRKVGQRLADVFLEVNGKSTAILIEQFSKRPSLTAETLQEHSQLVDSVCCYCSPWTRKEIEEVIGKYGLSNVLVADIPMLSD